MEVQHLTSDIINILPPNIIEKVLTLLSIRDAFRTSILSRKWRYCCASITKLVFDDETFEGSAYSEQLKKHKFVNAIYHVLLVHRGPILEFKLSIAKLEIFSEIHQILLHLSMSNTLEKFTLYIYLSSPYKLPSSFFLLQWLTYLNLHNCELHPPLTYNGFSSLTNLFFYDIKMTIKGLKHFLSKCPQIKHLTWIGSCEDFKGEDRCNLVELFAYLPLIEHISISNHIIKRFTGDGVQQKLPTPLVHLKVLKLYDFCFTGLDALASALCLIRSSPNLERIAMEVHNIPNRLVPQTVTKLSDIQDFSNMRLDHLRELKIYRFDNLSVEMDFVRLIMAKSSKLKKVRIVLNKEVSVDEESKILRNLQRLSFERASPIEELYVERLMLPNQAK